MAIRLSPAIARPLEHGNRSGDAGLLDRKSNRWVARAPLRVSLAPPAPCMKSVAGMCDVSNVPRRILTGSRNGMRRIAGSRMPLHISMRWRCP